MNPWYMALMALGWGMLIIVILFIFLLVYAVIIVFSKEFTRHIKRYDGSVESPTSYSIFSSKEKAEND